MGRSVPNTDDSRFYYVLWPDNIVYFTMQCMLYVVYVVNMITIFYVLVYLSLSAGSYVIVLWLTGVPTNPKPRETF